MATANLKAFCSSCGKENGRVRCEGCSKVFCLNDFNGHRQELSTQLDEIEVDRDLFRQMLTENISKPQNHALMKQIDNWEDESINKIRQVAEEARQIITKHSAKLNTKLEEKLKMLTDKLRQSRHENDFFEPNLNQWKEELAQMKNNLTKPLKITIRNDSTPLVTKIIVDILDGRRDQKSNKIRPVSMMWNSNAEQHVLCSFCNEEYSSSLIGQHLMICRNKTDQCPNCKKYIRRAILAYHYENNCANLDESEGEVNTAVNQFGPPSIFQLEHPPPSSSRSSARNVRKITAATLPNPQTVVTSQQSHSGRVTYIMCPYCDYGCDSLESDIHREKCLQNPKNMAKRQQSQNILISNQNTVQLNYVDQSNDNADIPCQYCNKPIKLHDYQNHTQVCTAQYHPPTLQQPQLTHDRVDAPATVQCRHCHNMYMINFVGSHEKICRQNPDYIAWEEQIRSMYGSAPAHLPFYN